MLRIKDSLFIFVLQLIVFSVFAEDSLRTVSFNSEELLKLNNLWLTSGNASGLSFNKNNELTIFETGILNQSGDFHLIRQPNRLNQVFFTTKSYQKINNRFFVAGSFTYNNQDDSGARWTGTYEPYRGNPYLLADSLTGVNTHKENYSLNGQAAWILKQNTTLGCNIEYFVAVAAKQKDPRPEITVNYFRLNPSVILKRNSYKIGFDAGYSNRKEEITFTTFKSSFKPVFFMFKGFGFHSKEIDNNFYRFQTLHEGFGGIQFEKDFFGMNTLTEIRGNYSFEKIEDGGSVIIREDGGDWKTWKVEFNESLKKNNGNKMQLITANFSVFNGDGIEYIQDVVFTGNNEEYVTISKNLKFNRMVMKGALGWDYREMKSESKLNWKIKTGIDINNCNEKYYFIPEIFSSSYLNLSGSLGGQKNLYWKNFHISESLMSSYTAGLSNKILLSNNPEITKNQRPETFQQELEYYSADVFRLNGILNVGYNPKSGKIGQLNIGFNSEYIKPVRLDKTFMGYTVKIGFVF